MKRLGTSELAAYLARQLGHFFPDETVAPETLAPAVGDAAKRLAHSLARLRGKYYSGDGFDHLHNEQYAMFLYLVGNSLFRRQDDRALAAKVYGLNKALHALDAFYEVELPEVFRFSHPLGTILGRARYANYFLVYQHCTIGSNVDGIYPTFGEGVVMYGNSAVIGDCTIGANCWLSYGAVVMDENVPANSVVFGRSPALVIKPARREVKLEFFQP